VEEKLARFGKSSRARSVIEPEGLETTRSLGLKSSFTPWGSVTNMGSYEVINTRYRFM
jgi:hypothetical protein